MTEITNRDIMNTLGAGFVMLGCLVTFATILILNAIERNRK